MKRSLLVLLCLLLSCSGQVSKSKSYQAERELKNRIVNLAPGEMVFESVEENHSYEVFSFIYRSRGISGGSKDFISGEFYKLKKTPERLAVLIPGMGESISTKKSASVLAENNFDVVRFLSGVEIFDLNELDKKEKFSAEEFSEFVKIGRKNLETCYADYFNIINQLKLAFHYRRIGISGVSLGGIFAYYLGGKYPEIFNSIVGIVTGGDLAGILMSSSETKIKKIRVKIFEKFDITEDEALKVLSEELFSVDPLSVAKNINPSHALLVSNVFDTVIKYKYTKKLWRASGKPTWKIMAINIPVFWFHNASFWLDGHYSAGIALFVPVPLFVNYGPLFLPSPLPATAPSLILDHFEWTLRN